MKHQENKTPSIESVEAVQPFMDRYDKVGSRLSNEDYWDVLKTARETLTQDRKAHLTHIREVVEKKCNGHCGKKDCAQGQCLNRKITREVCDDILQALDTLESKDK